MKKKYKEAFMDVTIRFGETSEAERLKVGCLIVKGDQIISQGVNGMPPGWPTEVCEDKFYMHIEQPDLLNPKVGYHPNNIKMVQESKYPLQDGGGYYGLGTKPECRHAEIAALEKLWNSSETSKDSVMFISHAPCKNCSIKIKTAGIREVYYRHEYRSKDGIEYLKNNGVLVEQLEGEKL